MDRKLYLIPALVSIGVHGLCFLTSPDRVICPPTTSCTSTAEPVKLDDFVTPPEPVEKTEEIAVINNQPRLGEPLPGLDELIKNPTPRDFAVELPPRITSNTMDTIKIGPPGVPDGIPEGELIAKLPPAAIDSGMLDKSPTARMQARPTYPHNARTEGRTGQVLVDFVVNERGEVIKVHILSSTDSIFEEPTRTAVYRWRFAPGTKDGKAVAFRMRVPVTFQIDA